ncbi:MAG: hypothetical protein ACOYNO_07220 [Saprospiraceae bacterium]
MTSATLPYPALTQDTGFSPASRVWMYVADRALTDAEAATVDAQMQVFCKQWTAHNVALKARGEVFGHRVLLLMVDESRAGASGCSIDKSVHFLEQLGHDMQIDWFDRMQFGWLDDDGVINFASRDAFSKAVADGIVSPRTPVLNTLADTLEKLQTNFWMPFELSWHKKLV